MFVQALEAAAQVDREWSSGTLTLQLEAGPFQARNLLLQRLTQHAALRAKQRPWVRAGSSCPSRDHMRAQVNVQDERSQGWFLLAFPRGVLTGRRLEGAALDTLALDVERVGAPASACLPRLQA